MTDTLQFRVRATLREELVGRFDALFPAGSYPSVIARMYNECMRVLKPAGSLIVITPRPRRPQLKNYPVRAT